jgi:hypothetical protein
MLPASLACSLPSSFPALASVLFGFSLLLHQVYALGNTVPLLLFPLLLLSRFVEPPVLNLAETLADSTPASPLIFVLSAGVDPTDQLRKLAAVSAYTMPCLNHLEVLASSVCCNISKRSVSCTHELSD